MLHHHPQRLATGLIALGLVLIGLVGWLCRQQLGPWQYALYVGTVAIAGGLAWLLRLRTTLGQDQHQELSRQQKTLRRQIESELAARLAELDRREQALADRLLTYQQWLEFPQPINLASGNPPPENLAELSDLARRDRAMFQLLEAETETLYESIRKNKYSPEGVFDIRILRDDVYQLIHRVGQIYKPDLKHPILETSLARIVPAASRACLHFLVALDQLPLNVKDRSLGSIYGYVRQAVKAYGVYKKAQPYFPYVNSAYYLSRFALGANPMSMGAWWFVSQMGKRGAEQMANRLVNRQALALLNNLVRIVGYEVAGIYGGDFRHRDPNWIYAAELTDVISRFPLTQKLLSGALQEIGSIQLRSEYDRIYLYRCLAAHRSADPQRYGGKSVLTAAERLAIAQRIEEFIDSYLADAPPNKMARWKEQLQGRLVINLADARPDDPQTIERQTASAVRSLVSFLLIVKQYDLEELPPLLQQTTLYGKADPPLRQQWDVAWHENPPAFFEWPSLTVSSSIVESYLDDLIRLETRTRNRGPQNDELILDLAAHFRRQPDHIAGQLDRAYLQCLQARCDGSVLLKQLPLDIARAILDLLDDDERLAFVYGKVIVVRPQQDRNEPRWLIGSQRRCALLAIERVPRLLWALDGNAQAQRIGGIVQSDCQIQGGRWLADNAAQQPILRVPGSRLARYQDYFRPLLELIESRERAVPG